MESNRSHPIRTLTRNASNSNSNTTNELFLCFTSRLSSSSSSSMKISKSILSPGRSARDPSAHQISLSSSLSRRLKTNGSLKGGQSPMFPSSTKKKTGAGFENPEPSSPKVTCIGQVRVKSKKKKNSHSNNTRSRSQRRSGDYSFRRIETSNAFGEDGNNGLKRQSSTSYRNREIELESSQRHGHSNNQKWVHIPVTICESLRSFGADFNCFLPCRSASCVSDREQHRGGGEAGKGNGEHGSSSCGSVLARWLVAVQEGEGGEKGRQIELVVGGDEENQHCGRRSYRKRHVMEDIDIREIEKELKDNKVGSFGGDEVVEGRVSICIPPKNALLLMRCGSDPLKMAALANRFWEPPALDREEEEEEEEKNVHGADDSMKKEEDGAVVCTECETEQVATIKVPDFPEESMSLASSEAEEFEMPEMEREDENLCDKFVTEEMYELSSDMEQAAIGVEDDDAETLVDEESGEVETIEEEAEEDFHHVSIEDDRLQSVSESDDDDAESETEEEKPVEKESSALPECLLLMMCEPKLSMEVCEETWVCSTDFIRWLPPRELKKKKSDDSGGGAGGGELSRRVSIRYKPPTAPAQKSAENLQARSSCSYPAPLAKQEPTSELVYLTRCKSEPRRTAAKLAVQEGCFWKMKPLGVGAAGVGF